MTDVKQLALGMWVRESATFQNYVAGPNAQVITSIEQACSGGSERFVYLWGGDGVGKSHLLQAACNAVAAQGESSVYLPLGEPGFLPEMLEGLEHLAVVAIDELEAVVGNRSWETALFNLYNRTRDQGSSVLLVASQQPLAAMDFVLPDLQSRLAWGLVFHMHSLSDDEKLTAMQLHADGRGFELSEEVGRYLLRNYQRDMTALFELLDLLDKRSLAEQRRLTIPFVKESIGNE